tara:strand:- start:1603 stop:2358 length:756 start_codon:yes stop_codon:yes gene_type:complete
MAGHSQFKNIMHRKGAQDAKRAKLFAKLAREITVAAKSGIADPKQNPRLRSTITNARNENMPNEKIKKALLKASSNDPSENYYEMRYEGFGNKGISIIIETLTNNKNRTASEVRTVLTKNGGNLAETGSVSFNFEQVGEITFSITNINKDSLINFSIEIGAIDILEDKDLFKILCTPNDFGQIRVSLEKNFSEPLKSRLIWNPINFIDVDKEEARKIFNIIESLEENDDVQNVYTNIRIADNILRQLCDNK